MASHILIFIHITLMVYSVRLFVKMYFCLYIYIYYQCIYVQCEYRCYGGQKRALDPLKWSYSWFWTTRVGCWKVNLGSLKVCFFITSKPSISGAHPSPPLETIPHDPTALLLGLQLNTTIPSLRNYFDISTWGKEVNSPNIVLVFCSIEGKKRPLVANSCT